MRNITQNDRRLLNVLFDIEHEKYLRSMQNFALLKKQQLIEQCKERLIKYIAVENPAVFTITNSDQTATVVISTTTNEVDVDYFVVTISESFETYQVEEVCNMPIIEKKIVKPYEKSKLVC